MGISDYLTKIEELTNTNLQLLKTLNDVFYTDQSHLSVNLGERGSFVVPSFITLENKINSLQDNFENLVNSPITSEAYFTFDGNSRSIQVKGYEQAPSPLSLPVQDSFYHENNNVFKDFLTPVPYLKFDVSEIPNDINTVMIRKVAAISDTLKARFANLLGDRPSVNINWGDIKKMLDVLVQDKDYVLYDTTQKLPVKTGQGTGTYIIKSLISDEIDENLDQHLTIQLSNDIDGYQKSLTYLLFDQTIERNLSVGDYLVNWDGTSKFQIEELNFNTNTIKMKVLYGEYSGLTSYDNSGRVDDSSKIRFFSNPDIFTDERYAKVTLEEDEYIFIAISPVNDKMNIRAPWGNGLLVHVDNLVNNTESENSSFRAYYSNCRNIGDILNEISKVMSNTTTNHLNDELNDYMSAKPTIDRSILQVVHINKHLDDSTTIKNIRALYSQKNNYNTDLTETQNSITELQNQLSSVDFQDTSGMRVNLQNQISTLTTHKNELLDALIKITEEISLTANNSVVPLEGAKYRIRGFFDYVGFTNGLSDSDHSISEENIKGIYVQYRYRNPQIETGTAQTFVKDSNNDGKIDENETFIFSDWNELRTPLRPRIRRTDGTYGAYEDTSNKNLPSFNQIDIPISQGEYVDVRLKVIYDFGYPFIQMYSDWSDVVTYEFPEQYIKDVQVLDIIEENNNDIETNRFKTILSNYDILDHIENKIIDQDVTYYHHPESISSGFYTDERRIIPLKDKLLSMNNDIISIKDEINGTAAEQLEVSVNYDESSVVISPFEKSKVLLKEYNYFSSQDAGPYGYYEFDDQGIVHILCPIKLTNKSDRSLKIYSMFPGSDGIQIGKLTNSKFDKENYNNIWYKGYEENTENWLLQTTNQILTFRNNNLYDGTSYYSTTDAGVYSENNKLYGAVVSKPNHISLSQDTDSYGMAVYPYVFNDGGLLMTYKEAYSYMLLNPNDEIMIPIKVEYRLNDSGVSSVSKTISFDIRTSLYNDPQNYIITFVTNYLSNTASKLVGGLIRKYTPAVVKTKQYKSVVK